VRAGLRRQVQAFAPLPAFDLLLGAGAARS